METLDRRSILENDCLMPCFGRLEREARGFAKRGEIRASAVEFNACIVVCLTLMAGNMACPVPRRQSCAIDEAKLRNAANINAIGMMVLRVVEDELAGFVGRIVDSK